MVTAFLSRFFLHEAVSPWRWAGVLLITCGVGLVARGPSLTVRHDEQRTGSARKDSMNSLKLWVAIGDAGDGLQHR